MQFALLTTFPRTTTLACTMGLLLVLGSLCPGSVHAAGFAHRVTPRRTTTFPLLPTVPPFQPFQAGPHPAPWRVLRAPLPHVPEARLHLRGRPLRESLSPPLCLFSPASLPHLARLTGEHLLHARRAPLGIRCRPRVALAGGPRLFRRHRLGPRCDCARVLCPVPARRWPAAPWLSVCLGARPPLLHAGRLLWGASRGGPQRHSMRSCC